LKHGVVCLWPAVDPAVAVGLVTCVTCSFYCWHQLQPMLNVMTLCWTCETSIWSIINHSEHLLVLLALFRKAALYKFCTHSIVLYYNYGPTNLPKQAVSDPWLRYRQRFCEFVCVCNEKENRLSFSTKVGRDTVRVSMRQFRFCELVARYQPADWLGNVFCVEWWDVKPSLSICQSTSVSNYRNVNGCDYAVAWLLTTVFYFAPVRLQTIVISMSVSLSVHLHNSKTATMNFKFFYACCLWPWLHPPVTALWYVVCFRFCGWRHVFI